MRMPGILEIACFNIESALIAERAGADRVELCVDYEKDGISPPVPLLLKARDKIKIPVHVMVRPRAGNFVYSEREVLKMTEYIKACEKNGMDGIVFGALSKENQIDVNVSSRLLEVAGSMSVTFHRAIDECLDIEHAVGKLIDLGVHRVLTSGGEKDALSGLACITQLQSKFGKKIIIMPGGGLRSKNLDVLKTSACHEFHSSALNKNSSIAVAAEIKALKQLLT